mmetsp:Transcript_45513/g.90152  ORF Transcript_45513/g.90152 Transcript_45513/m.90152 type:complete len:332 (+) Transcript_45513:83-1078(+)
MGVASRRLPSWACPGSDPRWWPRIFSCAAAALSAAETTELAWTALWHRKLAAVWNLMYLIVAVGGALNALQLPFECASAGELAGRALVQQFLLLVQLLLGAFAGSVTPAKMTAHGFNVFAALPLTDALGHVLRPPPGGRPPEKPFAFLARGVTISFLVLMFAAIGTAPVLLACVCWATWVLEAIFMGGSPALPMRIVAHVYGVLSAVVPWIYLHGDISTRWVDTQTLKVMAPSLMMSAAAGVLLLCFCSVHFSVGHGISFPLTCGCDSQGSHDNRVQPPCVVCLDLPREFAMIPCGHLALCATCQLKLCTQGSSCPVCRQLITSTVRVFQS